MEYVLRDMIGKSVIVFIDAILVFSDTLEEHKAHVHQVLEALRTHKLYLKPKKCELFRNSVPLISGTHYLP